MQTVAAVLEKIWLEYPVTRYRVGRQQWLQAEYDTAIGKQQ